jgi:hypothetical protein
MKIRTDAGPSDGRPGMMEQLESRMLLGGDPFPSLELLEDPNNPVLRLQTDFGPIDIEVLANRDPVFAGAYLASFNGADRDQTVFHHAVDGVSLEAGRWSFLGDEDAIAREASGFVTGEFWIPPAQPQGENLARTVVAMGRRTPAPPFSLFYSGAFYFNLQDNAPPAPEGEYAVIARVLGDASWGVVQAIAGLETVDFGSGLPFPNRGYQTPVREAWTEGDPVTPDLLAQVIDVSLIKAQGAPDYYRHAVYSAEGFTGSTINEFVPIENPNDQEVYYELWARYEAIPGEPLHQRDQLIQRGTLAAHTRGGVSVSTELNWSYSAVRHGVPYALEVRSTLPVAAALSHYDFGAANGEAFTDQLSTEWTFASLGSQDTGAAFITWHNPTSEPVHVMVTGNFAVLHFDVGPYRRGGMALDGLGINESTSFAFVLTTAPILAQLSYYDRTLEDQGASPGGFTAVGSIGPSSDVGVVPLALLPDAAGSTFGLARFEFSAFNDLDSPTTIDIELYAPGSATPVATYIEALRVLPGQTSVFRYPGDAEGPRPEGPLTLVYRASAPIHTSIRIRRPEDLYSTPVATVAAREFLFAEGFIDPARVGPNVLEEHVAVFNPHAASFGSPPVAANVTFTFRYTDGFSFSIQRTVGAGMSEVIEVSQVAEVLEQAEENARFYYSVEVRSDVSVIAQMLHTDATLGGPAVSTGGFTTLGTMFGERTRLDQLPPG